MKTDLNAMQEEKCTPEVNTHTAKITSYYITLDDVVVEVLSSCWCTMDRHAVHNSTATSLSHVV